MGARRERIRDDVKVGHQVGSGGPRVDHPAGAQAGVRGDREYGRLHSHGQSGPVRRIAGVGHQLVDLRLLARDRLLLAGDGPCIALLHLPAQRRGGGDAHHERRRQESFDSRAKEPHACYLSSAPSDASALAMLSIESSSLLNPSLTLATWSLSMPVISSCSAAMPALRLSPSWPSEADSDAGTAADWRSDWNACMSSSACWAEVRQVG